ncbi:MAG: hypothetical protein LBL86_03115 [Coriobacteriales bacterium]|jgi:uncharacterized protein (DUF697 family)|nr:hypothetical protein [Coriobacteriales bacterium]
MSSHRLPRKRRARALPVSPSGLLEAIGLVEEQGAQPCRLTVLVDSSIDPGLLSFARQAFRPQADNLAVEVTPYFDAVPPIAEDSTLAVVLAAEAPVTGQLLVQALRQQVPAAVVTLDAVRLQRLARDRYNEIDPLSIVTVEERGAGRRASREERGAVQGAGRGAQGAERGAGPKAQGRFERLFDALGAWVVRRLPDEQLALARALGFVRGPFVRNAVQAVALQNAAIAAVFFLPGADMPLLTLNQMRLFLRIAAAYDVAFDRQRIYELAVLLLSGLGFRTLARRLVGMVPVLGWAVRGGVGYTGTLAIGAAAQEYFERGGDLRSLLARPQGRSQPDAGPSDAGQPDEGQPDTEQPDAGPSDAKAGVRP